MINLAVIHKNQEGRYFDIELAASLLQKACEISEYRNVNAVGSLFLLEHQRGRRDEANKLLDRSPPAVKQAVMGRLQKN